MTVMTEQEAIQRVRAVWPEAWKSDLVGIWSHKTPDSPNRVLGPDWITVAAALPEQDESKPACGALSSDDSLRPRAVCVRPKGHLSYHGTDQDMDTSADGYFWHDNPPGKPKDPKNRHQDSSALLELVDHLERENQELRAENLESARLLGMGGSREAKLITEVQELKREIAKLKGTHES